MGFKYGQSFWDHACDLCDDWQISAVDKLTHSRGGIVWAKVGEGKTRVGLFIFASLQNIYGWSLPSICLVVCRRRAFYDMRSEISLCFPTASIYEDETPVHPPSSNPVFLLVSHAELAKRQDDLCQNELIRFVIFDELWFYANNESKRSRAAYRISASRKAVGLSGTVMKARDLCEVYCQAMAVHKHRYAAPTLSKFQTEYLSGIMVKKRDETEFPLSYPKKGAYGKIMRSLEEVTYVRFPKGRRKITEQFHDIEPTREQLKHFHDLKEYYEVELEDRIIEYDNALQISIKTQQIANGWIKTDMGKYLPVASNKASKLQDELEDILAAGSICVVWCAFRHDVEMLADRLPFTSLQMLGGKDFDIDRWNFGDIRLCLATEASGSSVNYFSNTPYAIYYSANHKWLDMQQSRGRHDRKSSRHNECFYKYLQVQKSLDAHIYRVAMESGDCEARLIAATNQWLKS